MFLEGTPFPTKSQYPLYLGKFLLWMRNNYPKQTANQVDKLQAHILCMYFLTKQLNFLKVWFFVYIQFHYLRNVLIHQKERSECLTCQAEECGESESTRTGCAFIFLFRLEAQIYCQSRHRQTATNWFPKTHWDMTGSYEIIPTLPYNCISMHSLNSD